MVIMAPACACHVWVHYRLLRCSNTLSCPTLPPSARMLVLRCVVVCARCDPVGPCRSLPDALVRASSCRTGTPWRSQTDSPTRLHRPRFPHPSLLWRTGSDTRYPAVSTCAGARRSGGTQLCGAHGQQSRSAAASAGCCGHTGVARARGMVWQPLHRVAGTPGGLRCRHGVWGCPGRGRAVLHL